MRVAILGAPGTGKTALAQALRAQSTATLPLDIHDDPPLDAFAPGWGLVLLTALDGRAPVGATTDQTRTQADLALRQLLRDRGIAYSSVHGNLQARLQTALQVMAYARGTPPVDGPRGTWRWSCDKCSDPDCEHRLFRDLCTPAATRLP